MAVVALHTAATGLNALSTEIDVIANNLANVNTDGFKSSRVNFEDLLYQEKEQPGVENARGDQTPAGLFVGLGTRISNTQFNFLQGSAINTGNDYDLMINGNGFFRVTTYENQGNGIGYTRAGNFFRNSDGDLVLGNSDGPRLEPPVTVDEDVTGIEVTSDGRVLGVPSGQVEAQQIGQIELTSFLNPKGLKPIGKNLFVESDASGPPIEGNPGEGPFGTITQGFLEGSNVDPVKELVELIKAQRAFELNSQTIQAADESLQVVSNLTRF